MSYLTSYIASLPSQHFTDVKNHFLSKGCRMFETDFSYMLIAPHVIPTEETMEFQLAMTHAVGTILAKDTNQLMCFGFPKTQEISYPNDKHLFNESVIATEYLTGTLIRAYHDGDIWRLTTNGAIDAYDNYWISPRPIGELFDECLQKIYGDDAPFAYSQLAQMLNTNYTYHFTLQHPEIHLEMVSRPYIYHINTFDNKNLRYVEHAKADRLPRPLTFFFDSIQSFHKHFKQSSAVGFTLCESHNTATQTPRFKIFKPEYSYKIHLLGNTSNLYLLYLQCKESNIHHDLLFYFPTMRYYAETVEYYLYLISHEVYESYKTKYILKNYDTEINYYYRPIISMLHADYQKTQITVTPQAVFKLLNTYHPKRINFILNGLGYIHTKDDIYTPEFNYEHQNFTFFTNAEYINDASLETVYNLIHTACYDTIVCEINLDQDAGIRYPREIYHLIFAEFLKMTPNEMAYCLEEHSFIVDKITEFKGTVLDHYY